MPELRRKQKSALLDHRFSGVKLSRKLLLIIQTSEMSAGMSEPAGGLKPPRYLQTLLNKYSFPVNSQH